MSSQLIRKISLDDVSDLEHIHRACFKSASWDTDIFHSLLTSGSFGWRHKHGFIMLRMHDVLTFCVLPHMRRQAIGSLLLEEVLKNVLPPIYLEVDTQNRSAIRLYQSYGFSFITHRKNYYGFEKHAFLFGYNIF